MNNLSLQHLKSLKNNYPNRSLKSISIYLYEYFLMQNPNLGALNSTVCSSLKKIIEYTWFA